MANEVKPSFRSQLLVTAITILAVVALVYVLNSLLPSLDYSRFGW